MLKELGLYLSLKKKVMSIFNRFKELLKSLFFEKEFKELERWRSETRTYYRWLAEIPECEITLRNLILSVSKDVTDDLFAGKDQTPRRLIELRRTLFIQKRNQIEDMVNKAIINLNE